MGKVTSRHCISRGVYKRHIIQKSIYHPGTIFGSNGEGYIRFALCVKEENTPLIDFLL
jgi:hypothetical protein